ncbi:endonuclease [uncultured Polaribacter sp.]|uniref:endonuclease n=1 Tax=uncultured Polaribacter sp. TaxID=174711 RepID=UPI0026302492|nr:endonuclease [uncultured Polaribacter sp.]
MIKKLFTLSLLLSFTYTFSQAESYYNDVDLNLTGIALKDALATKIANTHTNFLTYTPDVWIASKVTDVNPVNPNEVLLIYGYENGSDQSLDNDRERGINDNGGSQSNWNREHVFARSLGNPNLGTVGPGADAHHLRPSDASRNSSRSNRKFGRGSGISGFSTLDFHNGNDGPNTAAWYPGDEWKGDVARMMMYMYLRYGNVCLPTAVGVGSADNTPDDMIDLFLVWNVEDPVSDFEKVRNTYHENTANSAAQGNRNPFIDNPFLATRIWGGDSAQDTWGIYTTNDTEAPSVPSDVTISNQNFTSFDVTWMASTDNEAVTGYDIFVNGTLTKQTTSNTNTTITELNPNTTYSITVLAKDLVNNKSTQSTPVNGTTSQDSTAPTAPTNVTTSNISDSSFKITWSASTDNNMIKNYEVYLDGNLNATVTALSYTISGLEKITNYTSYVLAVDTSGNKSVESSTVNTTTSAGGTGAASELFISEYVEPQGGNNKAIEIVNLTGSTIDLSGYDLRRNPSGGSSWSDAFFLDSGSVKSILPNDVFVITNPGADNSILVAESDLKTNASIDNGAPLSFNGDDPVGLFKNGVLIDIVGEFNGSNGDFAKDKTLRRNSDVTGPTTTYNEQGEWTSFPENTFNGIGSHETTTASINDVLFNNFKMFPNPVEGNSVLFSTDKVARIEIYNVLGKLMIKDQISSTNKELDISNLNKGIYIVKIVVNNNFISKKLIKK